MWVWVALAVAIISICVLIYNLINNLETSAAPSPSPAPAHGAGGTPPAPGDHNTASADVESSVPSCTGIRRRTNCNSPESPEVSIQEDNCVNGYVVLEDDSTKGYQCIWVTQKPGITRDPSCDSYIVGQETDRLCTIPVPSAAGTPPPPVPRTPPPPPPPAPPPAPPPSPSPSPSPTPTHHCVCRNPFPRDGYCLEDEEGPTRRMRPTWCTNRLDEATCYDTESFAPRLCSWEQIN